MTDGITDARRQGAFSLSVPRGTECSSAWPEKRARCAELLERAERAERERDEVGVQMVAARDNERVARAELADLKAKLAAVAAIVGRP